MSMYSDKSDVSKGRMESQTNPHAMSETSRAGPARVQATTNSSRQISQLQALRAKAEKSPAAEKIAQLQSMADKHTAQRKLATIQRASAAQVAACIGVPKSPAASAKKIIVDDLAAKTGGEQVGFDQSPTPWVLVKEQVKTAAGNAGYSADAVTRLVEKNPFKKSDIKTNSTLVRDENAVTSFFGVTRGFMKPQNHQLFFANSYQDGAWVMGDNFRNPYLASFFANDAIAAQIEFLEEKKGAGEAGELKTMKRENIVSKSGVAWAKDNNIKNGPLSLPELNLFLETENGGHSKTIADDQGMDIVSGVASRIKTDGAMPYHYFDVVLSCAKKPIAVASASSSEGASASEASSPP